MPASRASSPATRPRSTRSGTVHASSAAWLSATPLPRPCSRSGRATAPTRCCSTSTSRRAAPRAIGSSRPTGRSHSLPAGRTSRRSCWPTPRSSAPAHPHELDSPAYAADLNEIKTLGGDGITTPSARTAEQTEIARFWFESSPLQWNRIARTLSATRRLDRWQSARLFGLLNLALADGYVASFDTKYHYRYWRPVSAIRAADSDANPDTSGDPTWTPLMTTPPIPDYDSAHSVEGGAAAAVFRRFFGTDRIAFTTCSLTLPAGDTCDDPVPVVRSYATFTEAAEENGVSRILIGFHFRKAVREGIEHGRRIGRLAADRHLRPAR